MTIDPPEIERTETPHRHGDDLYCGVDIGASATKLVLLNHEKQVVGQAIQPSGVDYDGTARKVLEQCLAQIQAEEHPLKATVATGYGRSNVSFASRAMTEIHCHGMGCYHHLRRALTIVDIGGQDNKVITIGPDGQRLNFKMNRKCAAGTGAFLEEIALRLDLTLDQLDALAASTDEAVQLSSFCTVFAKTEILSHLRQGIPLAQVVRGAFKSVIRRVVEMDPLRGEVVLTGGVAAHNPTIARIFSAELGREVTVSPQPQFTGALGAALQAIIDTEKTETEKTEKGVKDA